MTRRRATEQAEAAFARIGAAVSGPNGQQQQEEPQTPQAHDATSQPRDAMTSDIYEVSTTRRHDVVTPRRRGPAAADAVALTVRFDPDEALAVDELTLTMRRAAGRRVEKSELGAC